MAERSESDPFQRHGARPVARPSAFTGVVRRVGEMEVRTFYMGATGVRHEAGGPKNMHYYYTETIAPHQADHGGPGDDNDSGIHL